MKKFGPSLKIVLLLIVILIAGTTAYLCSTKKPLPKLTVDEILQYHLQTRFDEEPKTPEIILLIRDRILTNKDTTRLNLSYLTFVPLKNDEVSINSDISNIIIYTDFHIKKAPKDVAPHKIDSIVGRRYKPIAKTSEGLLNVRYSIVIENRKQDFYFSEKFIDCVLCGTVPIYWGCPSIGKFFNDSGIIQFDTLDELEAILNNLSIEDYNKRLDAIKENFKIAGCYLHKDKYLRRELVKAFPSLDQQKPE